MGGGHEFAEQALTKSEHPRFEVLANYVSCALRTNRITEAREVLDQLDRSFNRQRHDIRTGLRARLAMAERDYETALAYTRKFRIPDRPVHLQIQRDALRGFLDTTAMSGDRRAELTASLKRCEERLAGQEADFDLDARSDN
jgi:Tfp pilus assembly protein PilF